MSYNVTLSVLPRTVNLRLMPHAPDGPVRITFVRKYKSAIQTFRDDHGISSILDNTLVWTVTKSLVEQDDGFEYYTIFDFVVTHVPGSDKTYTFTNVGVLDWSSTSPAEYTTWAVLGNYACMFNSNTKSNLSSSSYWSRRKALPYPTME